MSKVDKDTKGRLDAIDREVEIHGLTEAEAETQRNYVLSRADNAPTTDTNSQRRD